MTEPRTGELNIGRHAYLRGPDRQLCSFTYVSALSLWSLVSGHWSAWQAARVEVGQQVEVERRESQEGRVVGELIGRTDLKET